jgi:hypothetical protein
MERHGTRIHWIAGDKDPAEKILKVLEK